MLEKLFGLLENNERLTVQLQVSGKGEKLVTLAAGLDDADLDDSDAERAALRSAILRPLVIKLETGADEELRQAITNYVDQQRPSRDVMKDYETAHKTARSAVQGKSRETAGKASGDKGKAAKGASKTDDPAPPADDSKNPDSLL